MGFLEQEDLDWMSIDQSVGLNTERLLLRIGRVIDLVVGLDRGHTAGTRPHPASGFRMGVDRIPADEMIPIDADPMYENQEMHKSYYSACVCLAGNKVLIFPNSRGRISNRAKATGAAGKS